AVHTILYEHPIATLYPYTTLFRSTVFLKSFQNILPLEITMLVFGKDVRFCHWKSKFTKFIGDLIVKLLSRPILNFIPLQVKIGRSEEHTSELQSRENLVCSLLLEK